MVIVTRYLNLKPHLLITITSIGILMVYILARYFASVVIMDNRKMATEKLLYGEIKKLKTVRSDDYYQEDIHENNEIQNEKPLPVKRDESNHELVKDLLLGLIPPSPKTTADKNKEFEYETSPHGIVVRKLTNYKIGGFFVECGAAYSNTQFLERHLDWSGLLVEADQRYKNIILQKNRKSWFAPFCMSLNTTAYEVKLPYNVNFHGKIFPKVTYSSDKVKCYPFYTFMLALNISSVDYFSLNVDGDEVDILESIPFDKVNITVISVPFSKTRVGFPGVKEIMERKGYRIVSEVSPDDLIFVRKVYRIPIDV